jgi:hypothetical protein
MVGHIGHMVGHIGHMVGHMVGHIGHKQELLLVEGGLEDCTKLPFLGF